MKTLHYALIFILYVFSLPVSAQSRAAFLGEPAEFLAPSALQGGKRYPLIIFLPYTGGTASDFYRRHEGFLPFEETFIMLPKGRPSSADYLPNFRNFVKWYEERILADLTLALEKYPIDPERVVLAGFSLGGDLGRALSLRKPDVFQGVTSEALNPSKTL